MKALIGVFGSVTGTAQNQGNMKDSNNLFSKLTRKRAPNLVTQQGINTF